MGRRKRLNAVRKSGNSQAKKHLIDSSNDANQNNHDIRENLLVSSHNHQNTVGKRKRLNTVKQLIDSSNEINQNHHSIMEKCPQFGGDTRENVEVSSLNHQNTMGKHIRFRVVQKGCNLQAQKQLLDSSNEDQNNHSINVECAPFGGVDTTENIMVSRVINHQNTMGKRKRLNVQKSDKSLTKRQFIESTNEVNQNNHSVNEDCAQFGGVKRENVMVSSAINHQNTIGKRKRLNVQKSGKSETENQLIESANEVNQFNHSINEDCAPFGGDTRENVMVSSTINHQNTMGKRKRLNVQKSGKSLAERQLIESTNEVNQNNHIRNEEYAQIGGVDPGVNLMVSSVINHQNTTEKNKSLNAQKSGKSLAEKQLIGSTSNNYDINEECAQHGGDTRDNVMVSSLNHENDQSQSEQEPEESHVESHIYFGRMGKRFGKGQKRVRGYTQMSDVWGIPNGEFICVEVDSLGNPIGFEGKKLLNAMGCLVRKHQYAPINYLSWKDMPEFYITKMLELIQSKFQFVPKLTEQTKQVLKDNLSSKWRQFKHDLKAKGYDESKTEEEMAANIPDTRVDPSQYRDLVHHWCSEKGQKISNINKKNRSKYEELHCMGTKSLPRFIHETREANGVQPSRAQIYIDTRTRKNGSIVTEKAANVIDELKKHMVGATSSQNPQIAQDSTDWENDIYAKVKGPERRGFVRCLGKVPTTITTTKPNASPNVETKLHKLENLLGSLVSVLQTRFSEDQQINDVLRAIAQEVPNASSTPNDSTSNNQQTTSDGN